MRKTEEKRGWVENKLVGRDELGKIHDEEEPRRAYEQAIPDYVMWDFGLPEEASTRGASQRRDASGMVIIFEEEWLEPLLLLYLRDGGSYGRQLEERIGEPGFCSIRPGEMYRSLWQMEQEGMVLCDRGGMGQPGRQYELTETGKAHLESWVGALARYREDVDLFFRLYDGRPGRESRG